MRRSINNGQDGGWGCGREACSPSPSLGGINCVSGKRALIVKQKRFLITKMREKKLARTQMNYHVANYGVRPLWSSFPVAYSLPSPSPSPNSHLTCSTKKLWVIYTPIRSKDANDITIPQLLHSTLDAISIARPARPGHSVRSVGRLSPPSLAVLLSHLSASGHC
jgi:hypothetical protein